MNIYDGYDENKEVEEVKGITDKVTNYTYTDINYPCMIFKKGFRLAKHKVQVISNMVRSNTAGCEKDISLYFINNEEIFKMGNICGQQVEALLDIAGRENMVAFADKDTELKGSLIYTLCRV
jgi:hypothetical protein